MTVQRRPVGPKTRFAVLRAAGFRCVYCGRRPPDAVLQLDHVIPVAGGGTNARGNLVASCTACNQGKGSMPLRGLSALWMPVVLDEIVPERCPDERHPGPWQECFYGPPERPGSEIALVCPTCRYIIATRPVLA